MCTKMHLSLQLNTIKQDIESTKHMVLQILVQFLRSPKEEVRLKAAVALGKIKFRDPQVMMALVQALQDSSDQVGAAAAAILTEIKQRDPEIITALLLALEDVSDLVSQEIKHLVHELVKIFAELLQDCSDDMRARVAEVLGVSKLQDLDQSE